MLLKESFTHYGGFPEDTITGGRILLLASSKTVRHNLWIADYNFGRLHQFNRKTGQFKHYLTNNNMTDVYQGHDGKLWAGSDQGLYEYDETTDSFHIFVDPATDQRSPHCNHRRQ
jgi:sugar lactone lactonase YvrE